MNRKEMIIQLRNRRYSYQAIGKMFGLSRQRVHQIITGYKSPASKYTKVPEHLRKLNDYSNLGIKRQGLGGRDFIREVVRKRDNYTCQSCGKVWVKNTRRLDVHHLDCDTTKSKKYEPISEIHNMITLCHKCHLNILEHRRSMINGVRVYQQYRG